MPRFLRDRSGATAAEFGLILIPMILLTLGTINAAVMVYTASALHFAVEKTARWTAIQTTVGGGTAPGATAIQAYGVSVYKGATPAVTFTATAPGCGARIAATANYNFTTGVTSSVVPITASACYPLG
ncbi:MAG: TadE/TadG family type IV pilus assembly protein [Phenylobacterium sp.]